MEGTTSEADAQAAAPAVAVGAKKEALTQAQLLDYIKRQKLKISKLEKENASLLATASSLSSTPATDSVALSLSDGGSRQEPCLFWELIGKEKPFYKSLAKSALQGMFAVFARSRAGLEHLYTPYSCFTKWKSHVSHIKMFMAEQQAAEATRNLALLEQRCSKLKALLARTHASNKQQMEDASEFKRAQKEASLELRSHALEKQALMDQVRARDIESAFHQDLELYIQKAAEDVITQHQKLSSSNGGGASVAAKRIKELEDERDELSRFLKEKEQAVTSLQASIKEKESLIQKNDRVLSAATSKLSSCEARTVLLQRQVEEESYAKRDLEVELEITLKSRGEIMAELEAASQAKAVKQAQEASLQIEALRAQCEASERKLVAAQAALETSAEDSTLKQRTSVELAEANMETARLRAQVLELKQKAKNLPLTTVHLKGGEAKLAEIFEQSVKAARNASLYVDELRKAENRAAKLTRQMHEQQKSVLALLCGQLKAYEPSSSLYTAQQELEREITELEQKIVSLKGKANYEPMIWETSSVQVHSGKDIVIPCPIPKVSSSSSGIKAKDSPKATLEWRYSGQNAQFIALQLSSTKSNGRTSPVLVGGEPHQLMLMSSQGQGDLAKEFCGSIKLPFADGDRAIKICNTSLWGVATLKYYFRLSFEEGEQENVEAVRAAEQLLHLQQKHQRNASVLKKGCDLSLALHTALSQVDQRITSEQSGITESLGFRASSLALLKTIESFAFENSKKGRAAISSTLLLEAPSPSSSSSSTMSGEDFVETSTVIVLSCESVKIRAADDLRVVIPATSLTRPVEVKWSFELLHASKNQDVGFSLLEKMPNGALPQVVPYKRFKGSSEGSIILVDEDEQSETHDLSVLFDNSYSMLTPKHIRYTLRITTLRRKGEEECKQVEAVSTSEQSNPSETRQLKLDKACECVFDQLFKQSELI